MGTSPNTVAPARSEQIGMLQTLATGLAKHEASLPSLQIEGTTYTIAQIIAKVQGRLNATSAVLPARATWQSAVKADRSAREDSKGFLSGLRQALLVAYAGQVDALADFGLAPHKTAVRAPEDKVIAAQKAKATRAARHTMGKNQKAAVTGDVSSVTLTVGASSTTVTAEPAATGATSSSPPTGTTTTSAVAPKQA